MNHPLPRGWQEFKLENILLDSFYGTSLPSSQVGKYPILKMNNMDNGNLILDKLSYIDLTDEEFNKIKLEKGDILFNRTNSYELVGKVSLFNILGDYTIASYIVALRPNQNIVNPIFLNNILNTQYYKNQISKLISKGVSQCNINPTALKKTIHISLPPLYEQKRIADILSTFDDLIANLNKLIEKKEIYKKGVMQRVLSGEVRFNGFTDEWEITTLDKIIVEKSIRNKDNKINLVLSVTNKEGFVIQNEFFGKTIASKDLSNYKIVDKYDFAYNPARVNVGSISMLENFDSCIVSPMYVVFSLNKLKIDKYFFKYWIQSNNFNGHIRSLSAGSVRSILSFDAMSTMKIKLPSLEEQNKIAELLTLIDKDIEILKQLLHLRKLQKKGVMQKLLTGEVRL
ncbi:type I restriction-modification enzyme S subunit [Brachyspira pilosicoli WesB]|uniref:Type I restriction-modification enzyme S subunit n=2 Tax=Brachyspira pilosicoli TaxID=52584 RepID=K0JMR6_BRAPL|nr:type I restriction-modification enzyme S subunit [Brachyspira pilosicoli WesB]